MDAARQQLSFECAEAQQSGLLQKMGLMYETLNLVIKGEILLSIKQYALEDVSKNKGRSCICTEMYMQ